MTSGPPRLPGASSPCTSADAWLASGGLWVHSPAPLDDELHDALAALGRVRFVVAPSLLHGHVSMADHATAYPDAELVAAPGLRERRPDLTFAADLGADPDPHWASDLDQAASVPDRGSVPAPRKRLARRWRRLLELDGRLGAFGAHLGRRALGLRPHRHGATARSSKLAAGRRSSVHTAGSRASGNAVDITWW